jgi:hypothetical protein
MGSKLTTLFGFLLLLPGCGATATRPAAHQLAAAKTVPAAAATGQVESPASAAQTLAEADAAYRSQLGAPRAAQFELDRQVSELRHAILLYQKFLDLSDGRPELEPAIKKSREAIADLQATVDFLLTGQSAEAAPAELAP